MRRTMRTVVLLAVLAALLGVVQAADVVVNTGTSTWTTTAGTEISSESNPVELVKAYPPVAAAAGKLIVPGQVLDCTYETDVGPAAEFLIQVAAPPIHDCTLVSGSVTFANGTGTVTSESPFVVEFDGKDPPGIVTVNYQVVWNP